MPENLTTWKVKVWGMGHGTKVGEGDAEVVTRKNLIVRLQAPRFFVEKDEVVLSANVHNYLKTAKIVTVGAGIGRQMPDAARRCDRARSKCPAAAKMRVDWRVKVARKAKPSCG